MNKKNNNSPLLSMGEWLLWGGSVTIILAAFLLFDRGNVLTLIASLIGATSLIFQAKGNPIGPSLMIVFSLLYGIISFSFAYYGEMITYLGMTLPMSLFCLIGWLRHPFQGRKTEVEVNRSLKKGEKTLMWGLTAAITFAFYFLLKALGNANLPISTLSVATSFLAAYLTLKRHAAYALAYACNDIVLIVMWVMAARSDRSYAAVAVCFALFLVNDVYGFISWHRMQARQEKAGR
ncbi:MAG: nicotinamide mononucleotide transporter [Ruminococcaceae bacterium]|nr:nicotinamide mononucleotide transporter [Oscillospiraceae bacterium]